jgi:hypothetical protein
LSLRIVDSRRVNRFVRQIMFDDCDHEHTKITIEGDDYCVMCDDIEVWTTDEPEIVED